MGWFLAGILAAACVWLIVRYVRPSAALADICRALARGMPPPSFVARGAEPIRRATRDLEAIQETLRRQRARLDADAFNLRGILSSTAEGVMVVNRDFQILLANSALEKIFRLSTAPVDRTVLEALRNHEIQRTVRDTMLGGEPIEREISFEGDVASGEPPRVLALNASPITDPAGAAQGAIAVFHDISRIKWLEESRKQFVANTSHELRTPLAIFQGYLETLIDDPGSTSPEARPILLTLQRHSNRLIKLVEDLLTLSNLDAGTLRLALRPAELGPLVERVVADLRRIPHLAGRDFRIEIAPALPPIHVDTTRAEQIFYNLLENAAKYSQPPSPIAIRARPPDGSGMVECAVADQGIGIPAADLPRIFERFYRVEKARSRQLGGTGLGLSIVKHLVLAHGGTVTAESGVNKGTTVRFTFRTAPPAHPDSPEG